MKKIKFAAFVALIVSLSSCSFYNPISTNVPSYEKKGEINLGVNLGTSADVQISTNPVEHLSIIGAASTSGSITNTTGRDVPIADSLKYDYSRNQFELGIGYYYKLTDKIQHDIHIGYGIGSAAKRDNWLYGDADFAYRADFTNLFIQSSLVVEIDSDVKGYLSSRFNYISTSNFEKSAGYNNLEPQFYTTEPLRTFNEESYWLNQFGIGLIADLGPLQLSAQGQLNFRFTNELVVDERPIGVYAGVNFNIAEIISRAKKKD